MLANLDRAEFVALLNKLGSDNDADVLRAARDLHAKVTVSGTSWDALLAADKSDDGAAAAAPPSSGDDDAVLVAPDADLTPVTDAEKDEAGTLIAAIGALEISDTTRDELTDYAADLVSGTFQRMDLRYLRALYKRLQG